VCSLRQLADAAQDAAIAGHVAVGQVNVERFGIELAGERRVRHQRLQLGGEADLAAGVGVEERLLARAVAREDQAFFRRVVQRQRELSVEARDAAGSPPAVALEDHLGIAGRAERMAGRAQLVAKLR
jgi:hypothetical protein